MPMKKYLLLFAIAATAAVSVQSQEYKLAGYVSTDNIERCDYVYNDANQVTEIRRYDTREPELNYIVVVTYDESGREIRSDLYQDINAVGSEDYNDFVLVAYVELQYNESNLVSERRNYNNWGASTGTEDWALGGVLTYSYDESGRLTSEKTYFDAEASWLFQEIKYEYNAQGKLEQALTYRDNFGTMPLVGRIEYNYDESGLLTSTKSYDADYGSDELKFSGSIEYTYTTEGSLLTRAELNRNGSEQQKSVFVYSENPMPAADIVFPYEFDEQSTNEIYSLMTFAPDSFEHYAMDQNSGLLFNDANYTYKYTSISGTINIVDDRLGQAVSLRSLVDGKLSVTGVTDGTRVQVFRTDGTRAADTKCIGGNIDLSGLHGGTYLISIGKNVFKLRI